MTLLNCACIQLRSSDDVEENIETVSKLIRMAADEGAKFILTPENTGFLDIRKGAAKKKVVEEKDDRCLLALKSLANELGIWLQIGSLAVRLPNSLKFANRSFLINPVGEVVARYDKIHMFDVDVGDGQSYRESNSYQAGNQSILVDLPFSNLGMSICYDLRFPALFRKMAQAGANLITLPAAFTQLTGQAHWHSLLRARAIENGVFIMAAAQGGKHRDGRETFGHSMIISPWGEMLAEADANPCVISAEIDLGEVDHVRGKIPSLQNEKSYSIEKIKLG